ncbi:MFS transporter [Falsiroseomonas selenitidurans]|uniref:MFS transporter n=1 Tax=Falsiroseomonas selenitidurans TaxID=2716335 RepID=A0ABX1E2G6_9PROT|nr:MFS transporter [Falsiroseomonas selenitidurans]NKC31248.1 MFS transporter [Falsiroseomonas selenitidurans]
MQPGDAAAPRLPWRVPAALGASQLVHWGSLYYAFAMLVPAMAGDLGGSRDAVMGAFSAGLLAQGAAALLAGRLIDRLGARRVMTAGSLAAGLGLAAASRAEALWQLYAAWIAIGAVMAFTLYEAAFAAVAAAFGGAQARRGIAAVTLAGGFASTLSWPLVGLSVEGLGWRATLLVLAALNAACALLHWLCLERPARGNDAVRPRMAGGDGATLREILRHPGFWWLSGSTLLTAAVSASVAMHLVPALLSKQLDMAAAVAVAALLGPMQVAGRLVERTIGRHASLRAMGITALAVAVLALAGLAAAGGPLAAAMAVLAYGAANGVLTILRGAAPAELFGTRAYASAAGIVATANAVAAATGPLAVAWLWAASGGYGVALFALALVALVALAAFTVATRPPPAAKA